MGYEKSRRPVFAPGFRTPPFTAQHLTHTHKSTGTILPGDGTVILTSTAGDKTFRLPTPTPGAAVVITAIDSTKVCSVRTKTTAETFFNSTKQTVTFTTATDRKVAYFHGIGPTSSPKWMVGALTTGATIA